MSIDGACWQPCNKNYLYCTCVANTISLRKKARIWRKSLSLLLLTLLVWRGAHIMHTQSRALHPKHTNTIWPRTSSRVHRRASPLAPIILGRRFSRAEVASYFARLIYAIARGECIYARRRLNNRAIPRRQRNRAQYLCNRIKVY